ncbi:MAG: FtsW/RodA/SpoVE family cell cycle protein [Flavobacteriales bacterium]|jgi:cell division protein FtsW|nr:FtsW/RodA/SpoVE family cell cycle protein [Flavobacteriales bacterium]MCB0759431.1 FtsW/RodA/SpoVE family cell cycle protein [Flavobacteriales bacterium]
MNNLFNDHLKGDRTIWMVALLLGVTSLLAVYSASSWMGWRHDGGTFRILVKHALMLAAGGGIMYAASKLKYTVYSRLSQVLLGATIALLLLTLLVGANVNGATRWLAIPGVGITFQTSDLARVVIMVYLARVLGRHREEQWTFREVMLQLILPVGAVCGFILPANFSTAALLFGTCMILMFIGQVPVRHMLSVIGMAVGVFALLLVVSTANPELLPRLQTWQSRLVNHGGDDRDSNYQVNNAKIAIVHGGFLPNGPGTGTSRNFMPHPESDMIYAFIIEEYGSIIGGLGLLLLYLILLSRAMRIANRCEKPFGALVAVGLALSLVLQALVNMAVGVNLVPVTGQPLPLVSMGGTSMWFTCLSLGIILSVSRSVYDRPAEADGKLRTTGTRDHAAAAA